MRKKIDLFILSKYRNEIYGLAALMVMANHAFGFHWLELQSLGTVGKFFREIGYRSYIAVDIFIFLSGISLYFAYTKNNSLKSFISNRFARIVPSIIITIVPIAAYFFLIKNFDFNNFILAISTLRLWITGGRWTPWFVSAITVLYLIYPYVYMWIYERNRKEITNLFSLLVMVYTSCYLLYYYNLDYYNNVEVVITRIPIFIVGTYFGKRVYEKKKVSFLFLFANSILFFIYLYFSFYGIDNWYNRYLLILGAIPLTFFFAYLFQLIDSIVPRINRFLKALGAVSFEIYLTHAMVYRVIPYAYDEIKPNKPFWLSIWLICMVLSVVLALYIPRIIGYIRTVRKSC